MTNAEARSLFEQLDLDLAVTLPRVRAGEALLELCNKIGYKLGLCHETGDWVVWDENDRELARCE